MSLLVTACVLLAAATPSASEEHAHYTCEAIENQAPEQGIDPWFLAGMAWRESRFDPTVVGSLGELGPLQVLPQYVTGRRGPFEVADLPTYEGGVGASLYAINRWRFDAGQGPRWPLCYAAGNVCIDAPLRSVRGSRTVRVAEANKRKLTTFALGTGYHRDWLSNGGWLCQYPQGYPTQKFL